MSKIETINFADTPSLVSRYMLELRDTTIQRDPMRFRRNLGRIGQIMAYEISRRLGYTETEVQTPLATAKCLTPADQVVIATILRAGLPFHQGFLDYFDYAECLNDLVKTEHLRLTEDGRYVITEKGLKNSQICESSLPYSVRQRSDKNIAAYNRAALRRAQVQSRVTERENGTYTVTLALHDDVDQLMELQLMVADRPTADGLARRFQREPERLYAQLTELLCGEKND